MTRDEIETIFDTIKTYVPVDIYNGTAIHDALYDKKRKQYISRTLPVLKPYFYCSQSTSHVLTGTASVVPSTVQHQDHLYYIIPPSDRRFNETDYFALGESLRHLLDSFDPDYNLHMVNMEEPLLGERRNVMGWFVAAEYDL